MGLYLMERYRVAVDVAIHSPVTEDGHDPRNHHAHLLFTTRELTKGGFGAKTRILDDRVTGPQEVEIIREVWEVLANDALKRAGFEDIQIDRRSLEDQGVDRIPQTHEGKASKNAADLSLLGKDFREAEQQDKGEEEDGKEEGKKGSSSGGGGSTTPKLESKVKEDSKGRKIDYPALDQKQTRSAFNAEIKALNEKRAAFGDKPLKEQITQLDRLMERLDKRVEKLQTIKSKTSLPNVFKQSISNTIKAAAEFISLRREARANFKLTAQEKQAKRERQIARYGRDYRAGLHSQIKEMKQNIEVLEQKQEQFRRYKRFVDTVQKEMAIQHPSLSAVALAKGDIAKDFKDQNKKTTTEEVNLKLHLKAEMIRAHIPKKYRAPSLMKGNRQTLTTSTAVNKVLKTKGEPIKIDHKALTPKPDIKVPKLKLKAAFQDKAQPKPPEKGQPSYKQPISLKLKSSPEKQDVQKNTDRRSWFAKGTEKTKPLTDEIRKKMAQHRKLNPLEKNPVSGLSGLKKKFDAKFPKKEPIENRVVKDKIRKEAQIKRQQVPLQYRAKPYSEAQIKSKAGQNSDSVKEQWDNLSSDEEGAGGSQVEEESKPKMSNAFNAQSFEGIDSEPEASSEDTLDQDL